MPTERKTKSGAKPALPATTKAGQTEATTLKLIDIARAQFASRGYARTGTEELVRAAGVTRGALYHHFKDKKDLFLAVLDAVQREVGDSVEVAASKADDPWLQLVAGCHAFLSASTQPGVQQIMLIDGPAVLGWDTWRELDSQYALRSLKTGLLELMDSGVIARQPVDALAHLLSGAMNESAMWVARSPRPRQALTQALSALTVLLGALKRSD